MKFCILWQDLLVAAALVAGDLAGLVLHPMVVAVHRVHDALHEGIHGLVREDVLWNVLFVVE